MKPYPRFQPPPTARAMSRGKSAAEPPPFIPRPPRLDASNWRPIEKNTLRAFFSLTFFGWFTIHEFSLHQRGARRWVACLGGLNFRPMASTGLSPQRAENFTPRLSRSPPRGVSRFRRQLSTQLTG